MESPDKPVPPVLTYKFKFNGQFLEVLKLVIKNTLFTLFTFGLYIPYARTNMRKYIWSATTLSKKAFLFHADPRKLFKAYVIMFLIYAVVSMASSAGHAMFKDNLIASVLFSLPPVITIFFFVIRGRYGAFSYLVNNTSYRSIRFQVNSAGHKDFMVASIRGVLLSVFTLGIYYPYMVAELEKIKWSNTSYGNHRFLYKGVSSEYAMLCYKGLFLTVLTLGFYFPWFMVSLHKYKVSSIRFMGAKAKTKATGGEYFILGLKSLFLLFISLGLAAPYIFNMNLAFYISNLSVKGNIEFDAILQSKLPSKDESFQGGLADMLDADIA